MSAETRENRTEGRTLLRFTRQVGKYLTGDITSYPPLEAQQLFDQNAAVPYTPPKKDKDESSDESGGRRRVRS